MCGASEFVVEGPGGARVGLGRGRRPEQRDGQGDGAGAIRGPRLPDHFKIPLSLRIDEKDALLPPTAASIFSKL
jgi:hypothetical protein